MPSSFLSVFRPAQRQDPSRLPLLEEWTTTRTAERQRRGTPPPGARPEAGRPEAARDDAPLELTILMPCLDEAETLGTCIAKAQGYLARSGIGGEVLVADNGSTDGSREIAEAAGARVVPVAARGYGAALLGGIEAARGRFVVMGDADDSYDFSDLDGFVGRLRDGADLVMGNRFRGGIRPGAMPFLHRYLGNPVLSFLGRLFFRVPTGDFHCGLRGFRRDRIRALGLSCPGMEFASEMVVKAALHGLRVEEVPTVLSPDGRSRPPHLRTWTDGWRHLRFLLLHSPRWLFAYPGAAMLGLGLLGILALVTGPVALPGEVRLDIHTLIACCFAILIGLQLLMFSFISRSFASRSGILPRTRRFETLFGAATLERVLRLSAVLALGGLAGAVLAFVSWAGSGFGDITDAGSIRWFALSLTAMTAGFQLAASAFLASFVDLAGGH